MKDGSALLQIDVSQQRFLDDRALSSSGGQQEEDLRVSKQERLMGPGAEPRARSRWKRGVQHAAKRTDISPQGPSSWRGTCIFGFLLFPCNSLRTLCLSSTAIYDLRCNSSPAQNIQCSMTVFLPSLCPSASLFLCLSCSCSHSHSLSHALLLETSKVLC